MASRPRVRHLALPERAFIPVVGSVLLLSVWAGVAHTSGSGWVQTVGALVAGLLLLGLVAPAFAAPGLTLICETSPTDAIAGSAVEIDVVGEPVDALHPQIGQRDSPLLAGKIPARLVIVPPRRGVISTVTVRVRDRRPPRSALVVAGPSPRAHTPVVRRAASSRAGRRAATDDHYGGGSRSVRPTLTGDLRGVRPYQHGDGRRRVHWHASAHTGDLMIRESESRKDDPIRMVVDLSRDLDAADRAAEEAMGEIVAQLNAGHRIVLETTEVTGRVVNQVTDRLSAGRRLAHAVASFDVR